MGQVSAADCQSGNSLVRYATALLNNAQILALPTTAVTVVAAPGADRLIIPSIIVATRSFITAYEVEVGDTFTSATFQISDGPNFRTSIVSSSDFLSDGTRRFIFSALGSGVAEQVSYPGLLEALSFPNGSNQPLQFFISTTESDPLTGGNAANTFRITVEYRILDTATGLFV